MVVRLMQHGYMVVLPIGHWYHGGSTYVTGVPWWFCLYDRATMVVLFV